MWFRRLFRRRRKPPPLDLSALDRLEELIARVIALVPAQAQPAPAAPALAAPLHDPAPVAGPAARLATVHLVLVPGYELVERPGPAPARGARVEHAGRSYTVLRDGPSPLPGDARRCAFLESA